MDSEEAWKAVAKYFPPTQGTNNELWCRRATRGLGEFYLSQQEYDKALQTFQELVSAGETTPAYQAWGFAGEAIVYDRLGKPDEVIQRLKRLSGVSDEYVLLLDDFLNEEIELLKSKYDPNRKK